MAVVRRDIWRKSTPRNARHSTTIANRRVMLEVAPAPTASKRMTAEMSAKAAPSHLAGKCVAIHATGKHHRNSSRSSPPCDMTPTAKVSTSGTATTASRETRSHGMNMTTALMRISIVAPTMRGGSVSRSRSSVVITSMITTTAAASTSCHSQIDRVRVLTARFDPAGVVRAAAVVSPGPRMPPTRLPPRRRRRRLR